MAVGGPDTPGRHKYCDEKGKSMHMNLKRTFGALLTLLGIVGMIYTGYGFIRQNTNWREMLVIGIIGVVFFSAGIGLVRNTRDET